MIAELRVAQQQSQAATHYEGQPFIDGHFDVRPEAEGVNVGIQRARASDDGVMRDDKGGSIGRTGRYRPQRSVEQRPWPIEGAIVWSGGNDIHAAGDGIGVNGLVDSGMDSLAV